MTAEVLPPPRSHLTQLAFNRLARALGPGVGTQIGEDVLRRMGLPDLANQNEVLAFANHLIARGGVIESVGRALKVAALLRGATE